MAYAGLSGAFGTVSLGQVWSASFNYVGGITDGSWFYGNSETSYRVGNAVSYAMSAGAISMQLDAIMDGGTDTGDAVDQMEFGMSIDLGDIGKVGLAYVDKKDSMETETMTSYKLMGGTDTTYKINPGTATSYKLMGGRSVSYELSGGMVNYKPVMLTGTPSIDDDGNLMVSQWMAGGSNYDGDAPTDYKVSAYVNSMTGGMMTGKMDGYKQVDNLMLVKIVTADTQYDNEDGVNESSYDVSDDGMTYTDKTCSPENPCETYYRYAVQFQDEMDHPGGSVTNGYTLHTVGDDNKLVQRGPKMVRFHGADAVSVSAEVAGTAETSTIASITFPELTTDGEDTAPEVVVDQAGTAPTIEVDQAGTAPTLVMETTTDTKVTRGSRDTHIAAQFNLGPVTSYLGYSQSEENGASMKDKTTHYGVSGGIGDSGLSFHVMARNKDNASGMDTNPWLVGLTKGLGGGATVMVEHGNADDGESGKTRFGLKVDF